jgi:PIN like domain
MKAINILEDNTLIIMDSNVWLDLYKLPPTIIESIVNAISRNRFLFWLPHQVYVEFNRHVLKNRDEAQERYRKIKNLSCELLNGGRVKINQEFENLRRNNIFEATALQEEFNSKIKHLHEEMKKGLEDLDMSYQTDIHCIKKENDIILELIESLYIDSDSKGFTINELLKIYEEGEIRFKYNIPPGFTDRKKKDNLNDKNKDNTNNTDFLLKRKYGDLIMWKEILKHIESKEINLIFIQNEKKPDWWESSSVGRKIANVLTQEFQERTAPNSEFQMLDFEQLLNLYGNDLGMAATTVKDIVSKLKFEKNVFDYISTNKNNIIENYIEQSYQVEDRGYYLLQDLSVFGGTIESVEDLEVLNINLVKSFFESNKDSDMPFISANVEIECTAHISEYVNKYVYHSGKINFVIGLDIGLFFSIDFSDLDINPKKAYKITSDQISEEVVLKLNLAEFDFEVDIDEDMFKR